MQFLYSISKLLKETEYADFAQSFSKNQIQCKMWLVNELLNIYSPKKIMILGSWYCTVLTYLLKDFEIYCVDKDPEVLRLAKAFSKVIGNKGTYVCGDATLMRWSAYDTVINTSCEHMKDLDYSQSNTVYALQSNNYHGIEGHINCKNSLEEFIESTKLKTILYSGTLEMDKYERYMVIGKC